MNDPQAAADPRRPGDDYSQLPPIQRSYFRALCYGASAGPIAVVGYIVISLVLRRGTSLLSHAKEAWTFDTWFGVHLGEGASAAIIWGTLHGVGLLVYALRQPRRTRSGRFATAVTFAALSILSGAVWLVIVFA